MELTMKITPLPQGHWKASVSGQAEGFGDIYYIGRSKEEVEERMQRLFHALQSPHIKIDRVEPDGDVVLVLSRVREEGDYCQCAGCSRLPPPPGSVAWLFLN